MNDTSRYVHSIPLSQDRYGPTISSGAGAEWSAAAVRPHDHEAKTYIPALICCQGLLVHRGPPLLNLMPIQYDEGCQSTTSGLHTSNSEASTRRRPSEGYVRRLLAGPFR